MKNEDFMKLHDQFMAADLTYHQKQIFYMTAKIRYMGANPVKEARSEARHPIVDLFKKYTRKNQTKNNLKRRWDD